ncbi:unnamed protein product [Ectocarpus sp. 12 AP-2014]
MPRLTWQDPVSVSMAWCNDKLETAGVGVALGPGEEDQELVQHAERVRAVMPGAEPVGVLSPLHPFLNSGYVAELGALAFSWGVIRRWVAWGKAGELAVAASPGALPWAMLLLAGLRTLSGTVILIEAYGPYGLVRPIWTILPASLASQRTLDAPNWTMREAVDLGVLYVVLRLCPYSLVPAAIICRMEKSFR